MNLNVFGWSDYTLKYFSVTQFFKIDYIKLQQGHHDKKCT